MTDLESIAEFGFNFDRDLYDDVSAASNREVYQVPDDVVEEAGLEDEWMIKFYKPINDTDVCTHQNRQETKVYVESDVRDQDFVAPVLCGSTDYEWIVTRKLQEIEPRRLQQRGLNRHTRPGHGREESVSQSIIPEEWTDTDTYSQTEFGFDKQGIKVLDAGMFELDGEWNITEPLESPYTRTGEYPIGEYFEVPATSDEYREVAEVLP